MESIEKSVEIAEEATAKLQARNPEIQRSMSVVFKFLQTEDVILYGGTAINNLLPMADQFYDPKTDIPDYDIFSETPELHSMIMADMLTDAGVHNVRVRPGNHMGTFKVFANYVGVADITRLDTAVFDTMWRDSIEKNKVVYSNPNFLRMSIYLELSRPRGEVSRWTKVYKRLELLNKAYPIQCKHSEEGEILEDPTDIEAFLADNNVVVLGLHASQVHEQKRAWDLPIDLLVTPEDRDAMVGKLKKIFDGTKSSIHPPIGDFVSERVDITKRGRLIARVFETQACHSYHRMRDGTKVASIPTILQFFLSFLYADRDTQKEIDTNRLMCVAQRLMDLSRGESRARRFHSLTPTECIGKQEMPNDDRAARDKLYETVSRNRESPEFLRAFFSYDPEKATKSQKRQIRSVLKRTYRKGRTT